MQKTKINSNQVETTNTGKNAANADKLKKGNTPFKYTGTNQSIKNRGVNINSAGAGGESRDKGSPNNV